MRAAHTTSAESPGFVAPVATQKDDTLSVCGASGCQENGKADIENSTDTASPGKRFFTVQALLALRGYELRELASGALLVLRAGQARELASVAIAETFARDVAEVRR